MTYEQRRNRLTTRFSERVPVVKRRITINYIVFYHTLGKFQIKLLSFLNWNLRKSDVPSFRFASLLLKSF